MQHHVQQLRRCPRAVDTAAEPLVVEPRQKTGVVQVGMRQEHRIDAGRVEFEMLILDSLDGIATLVHAAVDKHATYRGRLQ